MPEPSRVLRIAHVTDVHVQPELDAARGFEQCLELAQGEDPDFLLFGGDMVMDTLGADESRMRAQWDLYSDVVRANVAKPVESIIGNHDVWGWENGNFSEPYGKAVAMDRFEMDSRYRSFDRGGWHFVLLDSTHRRDGNGYTARLDDEQYEWLADDLGKTEPTTPVLVASHIPILCACAFLDGDNESTGEWQVPGAWMHVDVRRIKDLFRRHPNVKACLSGHIHLADRVDYLDVSYYCNGAACGGWWKGPYQECGNGYAIVDLFDDGTLVNEYRTFEWRAASSEE